MNDRDTFVRKIWARRGALASLLWLLLIPLSLVYSLVVRFRNMLYSSGWVSRKGLPCPVISVGNLTVGGTGKTPTALWLADELARRGYRVAILSRGYKRSSREPVVLEPGSGRSVSLEQYDSSTSGDEPVMMAVAYGQRVGVGKRRDEVGHQLLKDHQVDVFVLDDGFQHRRLKRDLDLLLLGCDWSGWMIPAGPFREPRGAFRRADIVLVTGSRERWNPLLTDSGEASNLFYGTLRPKALLTREEGEWREMPLALLSRAKILAVCAIADPSPFYQMIKEWDGEIVDVVEFSDHHSYSIKDWQRINRAARDVEQIVTTEKDIVKLVRFPFAKRMLFALRVMMTVERGDLLMEAVEKVVRGRGRELKNQEAAHA